MLRNEGSTNMSDTVLRVSNVSKRFGGLQALSDVGIEIKRGQVYGLIGPNGAGKTTFFNVITGLYTPDSGSFELAGKPYTPTAVHDVAKAGIARTFQNIRLFAEMTALENVMVGRHVRTHSGVIGAMLRTASFKAEEAAMLSVRKSCSITWALANLPITNHARSPMATSAA
jgi:branched-chain amino acid transport system ATP-binding protein